MPIFLTPLAFLNRRAKCMHLNLCLYGAKLSILSFNVGCRYVATDLEVLLLGD